MILVAFWKRGFAATLVVKAMVAESRAIKSDEPATGGSTFRNLSGGPRALVNCLLCLLTILGGSWALEFHYYLPIAVFREQFLGAFLAVSFAATFLICRARKGERGDRPEFYDWILSPLGFGVGAYIAIWYPTISYSLASLSPERYLIGALAILLTFEAVRRLLGWSLIWLALAVFAYALFADFVPGFLGGRESSPERLSAYVFLDTNGILGVTLSVTATIVVAFILFGQALFGIRGDRFFTDIALALLGRYRGGTAKVAVLSSSLFGTVSGSAVSNVVVSGSLTIPMMKRSGYTPHMAAAIEAVTSTGGQIMPPVMGVAAFVIAEYLGVPYLDIAVAAVIPALLYYLSLLLQVHLEASKNGLSGMARESLPRLAGVMNRGWIYLVPIAVLIQTLLLQRWPAGKAGMAAAIAAVVIGLLYPESRLGPRAIMRCFRDSGRVMLSLVAMSVLAGIVIGGLQLSGLTFKFSLMLSNAGDSSLLLMLILTALACIVLGLGMPTTVIYVMLAVLIAPALIELGVEPIAAHFFIFYFGMLSMITPPVCIATYTAASIADANFWKAGLLGVRFGIVAYIVPFIFVYHPALLMQGDVIDILLAAGTTAVAVAFLAIGCVGYLYRTCGWAERLGFLVSSFLLILPSTEVMLMVLNSVGFCLGLAISVANRHRAKSDASSSRVIL